MSPTVSIITVCKNSERTIERTIQSVLRQTYANIEYIVIDGVSVDLTLQIIRKYEPQFNGRMKIISEPDSGIYDAMNKGIQHSSGELIGIINSDDWYEVDAVENMVELFYNHHQSVLYGLIRTYENGKEFMTFTVTPEFMHRNMIPHPTCFVPRALYNAHGMFSLSFKFASDLEFLLRLYKQGIPFVKSNKIIVNFDMGGVTQKRYFASLAETHAILFKYGILGKQTFYKERFKAIAKEIFWKLFSV